MLENLQVVAVGDVVVVVRHLRRCAEVSSSSDMLLRVRFVTCGSVF